MLTIDHHDKGGFFTGQEFFNDHPATSITKLITTEHIVDCSEGFSFGLGDNHALTGSQTVGLNYNGGTQAAHIVFGGFDLCKVLVGGGWDPVPC